MSELLPCPFCGGEANTWDGVYMWYVVCKECGAAGSPCLTEAEAIEAWNSRAERTCHVVKNSRKYVLSDGCELFDDGCSICNGYVGDDDNYCSNCGAKVVDE